jgi:transposase InsO family protein
LAWRLSITMEAAFCVEALEEALSRYGTPETFNTDQGSQFTSAEFTGTLLTKGIAISMDGKSAWRDERVRRAAVANDQVRGSLTAARHRSFAPQPVSTPSLKGQSNDRETPVLSSQPRYDESGRSAPL